MNYIDCKNKGCTLHVEVQSTWHNKVEHYCLKTGSRIPCNKVQKWQCKPEEMK